VPSRPPPKLPPGEMSTDAWDKVRSERSEAVVQNEINLVETVLYIICGVFLYLSCIDAVLYTVCFIKMLPEGSRNPFKPKLVKNI